MKKLLFLLSVAFSTLLLHAQTNQVVWLNGKVYYQQPVTAIDSITYDMNNMITGDTLKLIMPCATQQNPPSTTSSKVKLLDAQTNQAVWLNGKLLYRYPVTTLDTITYEKDNLITGDTLKLIMPRATREIVYQPVTQEIHDTITNVVRDTITHVIRDTVTTVVRDTIRIYNYCTTNVGSSVLAGAFSVSDNKKVAFTKGNLQCSGVTTGNYTWSIAENQYDIIANVSGGTGRFEEPGEGYSMCGSALAETIDLFCYSANNTTAPWGISISADFDHYAGDFVDWGTNRIFVGNGIDTTVFNAPNTYRTLTHDEWYYLLNTRSNASEKKGVARINLNSDGTQYANGLILLPDRWTCPVGITFQSGFASEWGIAAYATYQTFTLAEWQILDAAGAVFLPASGYRNYRCVISEQFEGNYWSATRNNKYEASYLFFNPLGASIITYGECNFGRAVRLVKDL